MEKPRFPILTELEAASPSFCLLTGDQQQERRKALSEGLAKILKVGKDGFTAKQSHQACKLLSRYLGYVDSVTPVKSRRKIRS